MSLEFLKNNFKSYQVFANWYNHFSIMDMIVLLMEIKKYHLKKVLVRVDSRTT